MTAFAERLRELRVSANKTQLEVANALGVSAQALSSYERGREPPYEMLNKIAKYFQVSVSYLLGDSNIKANAEEFMDDASEDFVFRDGASKEEKDNTIEFLCRLNMMIQDYYRSGASTGALPIYFAAATFAYAVAASKTNISQRMSQIDLISALMRLLLVVQSDLIRTAKYPDGSPAGDDELANRMFDLANSFDIEKIKIFADSIKSGGDDNARND